jgi:gluconokinase
MQAPGDANTVGRAARRIVVMGASGCGKSTVGALLAQQLGARFVEGDSLHPPANIERMRQGQPLTDDDRWPWLRAVAAQLHGGPEASGPIHGGAGPVQLVVATCSALKRSYRDVLRAGGPEPVLFVHLHGERALFEQRLAARQHAYMPSSLLSSQLATLEWPGVEEWAWPYDIAWSPQRIVAECVERLRRHAALDPF